MIPSGYVLGFDASYYQHEIDLETVRKFAQFAIFRCTYGTWPDPAFRRHVEKFAPELAVASYAWFRPNQDVNAQLEVIRTQLAGLPVNFIWADLEESSLTMSSNSLTDKAAQFMRGLLTIRPGVGVYTRTTFVLERMKEALAWIGKYPLWLASYPYANEPKVYISWEAMLRDWAPIRYAPYYFRGWPVELKAHMWQFAGGKFVLPGIKQASGSPIGLDLNMMHESYLPIIADGAVTISVEPLPEDALGRVHARLDAVEKRLDVLEHGG